MDFADLYTMTGPCSKESTKMDSEMDGEDISMQMEMSLKKISITENQSLTMESSSTGAVNVTCFVSYEEIS